MADMAYLIGPPPLSLIELFFKKCSPEGARLPPEYIIFLGEGVKAPEQVTRREGGSVQREGNELILGKKKGKNKREEGETNNQGG
jgi:hypothetical protein